MGVVYKVLVHRTAMKSLSRLPKAYADKVSEALDAMKIEPFTCSSDIVKLRGDLEGRWRLRLGDVRVVFAVDNDTREVFVEGIAFRGSVYNKD